MCVIRGGEIGVPQDARRSKILAQDADANEILVLDADANQKLPLDAISQNHHSL